MNDTGELFTNPLKVREDCKLVARTARNGWPISPERRAALMERLFGIIDCDEDTKAVIQAAKAVLAADGINQRREAGRQALKIAKLAKPMQVNVGVQVNNQNGLDIEQFKQLPADERVRLLREAIAAPPSNPGKGTDPA